MSAFGTATQTERSLRAVLAWISPASRRGSGFSRSARSFMLWNLSSVRRSELFLYSKDADASSAGYHSDRGSLVLWIDFNKLPGSWLLFSVGSHGCAAWRERHA